MAPYSKDLIDVWKNSVFDTPEMLAFTEHFHAGDITRDFDTTTDFRNAVSCKELNFVQFFIQRFRVPEVGACTSYQYRIRIEYYREDTVDNQNRIQEFFEVLDETVQNRIGPTWDNNVGSSEPDLRYPAIQQLGVIDNKRVIFGAFEYFATAQ